MSKHYVVRWVIDILDADDPREAARLACATMLAVNPTDCGGATCFEVQEAGSATITMVDLAYAEGSELTITEDA